MNFRVQMGMATPEIFKQPIGGRPMLSRDAVGHVPADGKMEKWKNASTVAEKTSDNQTPNKMPAVMELLHPIMNMIEPFLRHSEQGYDTSQALPFLVESITMR